MPYQARGKNFQSSRSKRYRIRFFGFLRSLALRMACASWRKSYSGLDELDCRLAAGERLILIFWHGKYVTLLPLLRQRNAGVFTSLSSRGDVIADILRRFGFTGYQLPDHGGDASMAIMRNALCDGKPAAIAVDGPLGPRHVVHRGAVQLASELDYSLIPASVAISRKRLLSSRWDKLELPRLFSRVQLVIGEPFYVPANINQGEILVWTRKAQTVLMAADKDAEDKLSGL